MASRQVYCQDEDKYSDETLKLRKNEVRLGTLKLIGGLMFEASYERILDKYSGLGGRIFLNADEKNNEWRKFEISPYYRFYFSEKKDYGAHGFFVEGFTSVYSANKYIYTYNNWEDNGNNYWMQNPKVESFTDFALGVGAGKKWVNHKGLVIELFISVGRGLTRSKINNEARFIGNGDLSIGYRF